MRSLISKDSFIRPLLVNLNYNFVKKINFTNVNFLVDPTPFSFYKKAYI